MHRKTEKAASGEQYLKGHLLKEQKESSKVRVQHVI